MTNIRVAKFPKDSYMRIAGRSGLASCMGLVPLGGVVDPDYTSVLCVILQNLGYKTIHIRAGSSIAQGIFESVLMPEPDPTLQERDQRGLGRGDVEST
jgi:dUTPase